MAAGNCVSPHMAAGNGLHSPSDLVILWMNLPTEPCPMRLLSSDSAALLELFARTNFRMKCDAAGERRAPPRVDDMPTRRNFTGRC